MAYDAERISSADSAAGLAPESVAALAADSTPGDIAEIPGPSGAVGEFGSTSDYAGHQAAAGEDDTIGPGDYLLPDEDADIPEPCEVEAPEAERPEEMPEPEKAQSDGTSSDRQEIPDPQTPGVAAEAAAADTPEVETGQRAGPSDTELVDIPAADITDSEISGTSKDDVLGKLGQGAINEMFAGIVTDEEEIENSGDPRVIERPDGISETSFEIPDDGQITLYCSKDMDPGKRSEAGVDLDNRLRETYGRTEEEHDTLRLNVDMAMERYQAAEAAHAKAKEEQPGSDNQLASLMEYVRARDACVYAVTAFCFNSFEPIVRYTPDGKYVNGELVPDDNG